MFNRKKNNVKMSDIKLRYSDFDSVKRVIACYDTGLTKPLFEEQDTTKVLSFINKEIEERKRRIKYSKDMINHYVNLGKDIEKQRDYILALS